VKLSAKVVSYFLTHSVVLVKITMKHRSGMLNDWNGLTVAKVEEQIEHLTMNQ